MYDTLGLDNIIYCINLVKAKAVFVSAEYLSNIIGVVEKIPSVQYILCYDEIENINLLK